MASASTVCYCISQFAKSEENIVFREDIVLGYEPPIESSKRPSPQLRPIDRSESNRSESIPNAREDYLEDNLEIYQKHSFSGFS